MKNTLWIILAIVAVVVLVALLYIMINYFVVSYRSRKKYKTPYVNTFKKDIQLFINNIKLDPKDKLCDLGCGDGKRLRMISKHYQIEKVDGYDINNFAIKRGTRINKLKNQKHIKLENKDLFSVDLEQYSHIYLYLFPHMMEKLELHLKKKAKPGTTIITNTFSFPNRDERGIVKTKQGKEKIFIYTV